MKVVYIFLKRFFKRTNLPYSLYLAILSSLAAMCLKKSAKNLPQLKQGQNTSNAAPSATPASKQGQNNGPNTASPASSGQDQNTSKATPSATPASKQTPIHYSSSGQEDQASIISGLHTMIQEEQKYREVFSQKLSTIQDLSERDKEIAKFVKERTARIDTFNQTLQQVADPNERQRLIREFDDVKGMCKQINLLSEQYIGVSDQAKLKEKTQKRGDIVEKYNGYPIESKRQQIRLRVEKLIEFTRVNRDKLPNTKNTQEEGAKCAICHKTGSVGVLPCGDGVHTDCLVEGMIFVWRQGLEYLCTCPGSCDNYISYHYFLLDDTFASNQLTQDKVMKEIFCKRNYK